MNKLIVFLFVAAVSGEIINAENELRGPATDFITEFLKGLEEKKAIESLKDCMKNLDEMLNKIKEAFDLIKRLTFDDIGNGIKIIIEIFKNFYNIIKPCSAGHKVLEKLIAAIANMSIAKLIKKFRKEYYTIFLLTKLFIDFFIEGDYESSGFYLGVLLRILLLEENIEIVKNKPETNFTLSFLKAIGDNFIEEKVDKCTFNFSQFINHTKRAHNDIKSGDNHKIVVATTEIIKASKNFFKGMKSCVGTLPNFHKFEQNVKKANPRKVSQKIIKNKSKCLEHLNKILTSHSSKNYEEAGTTYGNLLKLLFA